jgi:hypothetical protein
MEVADPNLLRPFLVPLFLATTREKVEVRLAAVLMPAPPC